jgi:hypothetical protein
MTGTREGGTDVSMRPAERNARCAGRILVRLIVLNPVLVLVLAALLLRYGLPLTSNELTDGATGLVWTSATFLLRPFSLIATWVDPYLRAFPEFVDVIGTLLLGLLPYVAADAVYRRLVW